MNTCLIHESAQFGNIQIEKKNLDTLDFICVLQEADAPNRNGRIYPKRVLEKALNAPHIQEKLRTNTWYCECNHPMDSSVQRQMTVDLRNVAFLIKEIWWEGNLLKGRCTTANTSVGKDMKGLIEQGCQVAFSLRAQGNVHTNPVSGLVEVEEGLQVLCYDFVAVPSHAKAFMEKICEATIMSMYGTTRANLTSSILCESENLFMQGSIVDVNAQPEDTHMDFTKNYTDKWKKVEDMYLPETFDEVKSIDLKETHIYNSKTNTHKKVLTEDFIVKDIRGRLSEMI